MAGLNSRVLGETWQQDNQTWLSSKYLSMFRLFVGSIFFLFSGLLLMYVVELLVRHQGWFPNTRACTTTLLLMQLGDTSLLKESDQNRFLNHLSSIFTCVHSIRYSMRVSVFLTARLLHSLGRMFILACFLDEVEEGHRHPVRKCASTLNPTILK